MDSLFYGVDPKKVIRNLDLIADLGAQESRDIFQSGVNSTVDFVLTKAMQQGGKRYSKLLWPTGCHPMNPEYFHSVSFTSWCYGQAFIYIGSTMEEQLQNSGTKFLSVGISKHSFIPGDLIFYTSTNDLGMVGIYIDNSVLAVPPARVVDVYSLDGCEIIAAGRPTVSLET